MIPVNAPIWQTSLAQDWSALSWQEQMQRMIRDPATLLERLGLCAAEQPDIAAALGQFPLRVTEAFLAKIEPGNWHDPLLLQILPQAAEQLERPGYSDDPLAEKIANPIPGLIHKYNGRVLLITTGACAVHCRYCFRRNFPYQDNNPSRADWQRALDYIAERPDIHEVILSGGDPLAANDAYLQQLISRIADIPHIDTLRLHTRQPLVLPHRITPEFLAILTESRLRAVMVIHCNHANEIDTYSEQALSKLKQAGVTLLNQSVLLRGINDDVGTLATLSRQLFAAGVLPYYLHLLDHVRGASHFEVAESDAKTLAAELLTELPGYLVPRLVREIPGQGSKTPIAL